jgi:integrase
MKGNITRRGKDSWRLKFDIGRDPANGKRRTAYKTVRAKTKSEAQAELRRELSRYDAGAWVEPNRLTVATYLETWLTDHAATEVSAKTAERYGELLRHHVIPHVGAVALAKLAPVHIQSLRTTLLTEGRRPRARAAADAGPAPAPSGLAPQTVKHVYRVLRRALRQAVKLRLIAVNPTDAVDPPKVERAEVRALTDDEAGRVLTAAKGTQLYLPVLIALTTGLRRGELLALRWDDIDLDGGLFSVRQSLEETAAGLRFKPPKTKRSRRTITLPAVAVAALREHDKAQKEQRLRAGVRGEHDALVFSTRDPETLAPRPIRPRNVTKEFTRICRRAEVRWSRFVGQVGGQVKVYSGC